VICHSYAHIYNYEGGGIAFNSGCSVKLLGGDRGLLDAKDVMLAVNPDDVHAAHSSLVSVENTSNKGGGACYSHDAIKSIGAVCRVQGLKYHLDGARLWNALIAKKENPKFYGNEFDTISVCFSKGLGCPVGSVLLGTKENIKRARRFRKVLGGGMRQAGYLAAAGIYALDHHLNRLEEDHKKARLIEEALRSCSWVKDIDQVETNIIIFYINEGLDPKLIIDKLQEVGILIVSMGGGKLRIVTHLDLNEEGTNHSISALKGLLL